MKLTWTFYPKGQSSITLTVIYLPQLDALTEAGYLDTETNTAYVNWTSFRVFNTIESAAKRALFGSLIRVEGFNPLTAGSADTRPTRAG